MKRMAHDPQSEPRYGERVPYVVVAGAPSARLIDLVVSPDTFIASAGRLRLNSTYYITKCVLPALERVLGLAGADVKTWFAQMPRARSTSVHRHTFFADATRAQQQMHGGGGVLPSVVAPVCTVKSFDFMLCAFLTF
jgi:DNA polymerase elongation subunit (family B)